MRARTRRGLMAIGAGVIGLTAIGLMGYALREQANLFYTPTLLLERGAPAVGKRVKIGGYVQPNSVIYTESGAVHFILEDTSSNKIQVRFLGVVPDLFGEGQGVVADGAFLETGAFEANQVLAKHDEYYAPPGMGEAPDPYVAPDAEGP